MSLPPAGNLTRFTMKISRHVRRFLYALTSVVAITTFSGVVVNGPPRVAIGTHGDSITNRIRQTIAGYSPPQNSSVVRHHIYVPEYGRLGNNMFTYASIWGIAKDTNRTPVVSAQSRIFEVFKGIKAEQGQPPSDKIKVLGESAAGIYSRGVYNTSTSSDEDVQVCCFLQSWKYFHKYETEIRQQFVFRDHLINTAERIIQERVSGYLVHIESLPKDRHLVNLQLPISSKNMTLIGVHVRRRDMVDEEAKGTGYTTAPLSYIHKAMNFFRHHYKNTLFLVCSEDTQWCAKNLDVEQYHDISIVDPSSPADLAVLSHCHHVIMTVGTYGWWAAWLANGEAVYYNRFPVPNSNLATSYKAADHFLPYWIGMGD